MKKKIVLLSSLLVGFVLITSAQNEKPLKIGIRAGWHSSLMYTDGAGLASTEPLNSFYVGIFKEKKIVQVLHFGSGLEYFQNGFKSKLIDIERRLHYVSIPLYLKVKIGSVYATGGTALNFKVAENNGSWGETIDPLSGKAKVFDLPIQAGLGVKILMFSVEARYNWGMMNVSKDSDTDITNQYFQIGLGLFF